MLGPERLGAVNFLEYAVGLIWSLASLGIPAYGMYRVAQLQALRLPKRKIFWQMTTLHTLVSVISFGIFYWLVKDKTEWNYVQVLLPIGLLHLIGNCLQAEWYLQGMQRFDVTAYRTLVFRILGILAILYLVLKPDDFLTYYWIIVITVILSAVFNNYWIQKDLRTDGTELSTPMIEWRTLFLFYSGSVFISCTDFLDATLLGIFSNEEQLGYYSNAAKLTRISLVIILALNTVVYPQFSQDQALGNKVRLKEVLGRSVDWLLYLSLPICFLYWLYADTLVALISGPSFESSVPMVRWMAAIPLCISLSNLLIYYGLSAGDKRTKIRIVGGVLAGLLLSSGLNTWLIGRFGGLGTALNSMLIEAGFALFFILLMKPQLHGKMMATTLLTCLLFIPLHAAVSYTNWNDLSILLIGGISSLTLYAAIQHFVWKHTFLPELTQLYFPKNETKN